MSVRRKRNGTVRCSACRRLLDAPPDAQSIRCAACLAVTGVRNYQDPVRQAVGFLRSVVRNFSNGTGGSNCDDYYYYGRPTAGQMPSSFPGAHGKKRALLVGISYAGQRCELKGTVNDVSCVRYLLTEKFGYPAACILVLTDEERDWQRIPTKENLRAAMRWLVQGCEAGDSLVFHFSGHGVQKLDPSGDEVDGLDEALCPVDFKSKGTIVDDEINETLVRPLPRGAKLHALVDACHSGTVLDLPYLCRFSRTGSWQWKNHMPPSGAYKGTSGGLAILISGCDDHQTSADTSVFTDSTSTGAMTYSFIQAMESEPSPTYGRLLMNMRSVIRRINGGMGMSLNGPIAALMRRAFNSRLTQEPQLSSSETFDVYREPFLL